MSANEKKVQLVRPINDYVQVQPAEDDDQLASGLYVPGSVRGEFTRGKVLAVGDGIRLADGSTAPLHVDVGDEILFNLNVPDAVHTRVNGDPVLLVREYSIVAILYKD